MFGRNWTGSSQYVVATSESERWCFEVAGWDCLRLVRSMTGSTEVKYCEATCCNDKATKVLKTTEIFVTLPYNLLDRTHALSLCV